MPRSKFNCIVKYKNQYYPAHVPVEVDSDDIAELLKIGAYDVEIEEPAALEEQPVAEKKPRKKGKK